MTKARTVADLGGGVPDPFNPVAVTGTTPSLDVGSYNFFDQGTLTANTTVSFTNVPTNARWSYTFTPGAVYSPYDMSKASLSQTISVSTEDTAPFSFFFKPDGTKMYMVGADGDAVYEYDLSTVWDVSTASYLQSFSVAGQDLVPLGLTFKPDGTKMYMTGNTGDDISEYTLSTAWDISTASYVRALSVNAQNVTPIDISFKTDGTKMYVLGNADDSVDEYTLSTAWNISTASYVGTFSVTAQQATPYGMTFKPDGTKMYIAGLAPDAIHEYTLSTAWEISTASYSGVFFEPGSIPVDVHFESDGNKMYVLYSNGAVDEYGLYEGITLTLPTEVVGTLSSLVLNTRVTYDFFTMDGGTTVNIIGKEAV